MSRYLLVLVANFLADFVGGYAIFLLPPTSQVKTYVVPLFWFGPFIVYLVTLYRGKLFARWPGVFRALAFCIIAFVGTQLCLMVALPLAFRLASH